MPSVQLHCPAAVCMQHMLPLKSCVLEKKEQSVKQKKVLSMKRKEQFVKMLVEEMQTLLCHKNCRI